MIPIDFPQRNFIYTKPQGWTDEQCMDLPVWRGPCQVDEQGNTQDVIVSQWKFSKEDLEEIAKTGSIWMSVSGHQLPPVSLFTENPFIDG